MRMYNSDGSEGEMCGNGLRCAVKFALDSGIVLAAGALEVETGRGVLHVKVVNVDGKVSSVSVDMGLPIMEQGLVPAAVSGLGPEVQVVRHSIDLTRFGLDSDEVEPHITVVSMGNPHVVFCCKTDP
jgi:diaminopimelate epimerase